MNNEEVLSLIEAHFEHLYEWAFSTSGNIPGLGDFDEVDQYGGEGKGDHWHSVKYFKEKDIYIKVVGFYQSYSSTEFYEGWGEVVTPQKKTITVYE